MKVSFGFDALEFQSHFVFRPSKVRKLIRTNQFHVKNTKMGAGRKFVTLQSMCQGNNPCSTWFELVKWYQHGAGETAGFKIAALAKHFKREGRMRFSIGLASDDVTKLSNGVTAGKLVLNKDSSHTKACWEKSLSLGEALYSFVERSERFWQLLHSFVRHFSKDIGDRTSTGPFFSRSMIFQHVFVWDAIFV